jgi:uncharacterized protein YutE (UPF0331/DUF86 family)
MYYVNREQIAERLAAVPSVAEAVEALTAGWTGSLQQGLAQERCLHLAIEIVTDVGSSLIDGFIMRDASSYEDIIEITGEEGVYSRELQEPLLELVRLRKPLVQDYYRWPRGELHPMSEKLAWMLRQFQADVNAYLTRELGESR